MDAFARGFKEYEDRIKARAIDAFKDDLGSGDITTEAVFKENAKTKAVIIAEDDCVIAGVLEARAILENGRLKVSGKKDGDSAKAGETVLKIEGSLNQVLARERVSLNYLARMSGIATLSRKLSKEYGLKVLFLRKTDPGLLFSEKRAVSIGGCLPHRINLSDGILIKDNHINELAKAAGRMSAIREAISLAGHATKSKKVLLEVEVGNVEEARVAAGVLKEVGGSRAILLDNMGPVEVGRAVRMIKSIDSEIMIEASGGITEKSIKDYLAAGADYVSTSIFMSARPCRFKLEIIQ